MIKIAEINGKLLSEYIAQTGLSCEEFCQLSDISRKTIYNVSVGGVKPSYYVIHCMAQTLNLTKADFLSIFFPKLNFKEEVEYNNFT